MPKLDALFDDVIKRGGSDLHLAVGYPPLARIRGELVALREGIVEAKDLEEVLFELVSPAQKARFQAELELDFAHAHREAARFRGNYFHKTTGLGAVFRLVPNRVLSLAELGCPEALWKLADRRSGLVLVTGPTGAGTSTTVAAMLDHINKTRACHILTIEEPIEFVHEPLRAQITQREIGLHAPSYAVALQSAQRENADVVFVGDLRDAPTMKAALTMAAGGGLVFATMHTNGAAATIERIVNAFCADEQAQIRALVAESLAGVVSQQLMRTADNKARAAAHEIFVASPATTSLLREGKTAQLAAVMQSGQAQGMQTLDMALERLLSGGRIAAEPALERAVDKEAFAQVIARVRPDLAEKLG